MAKNYKSIILLKLQSFYSTQTYLMEEIKPKKLSDIAHQYLNPIHPLVSKT